MKGLQMKSWQMAEDKKHGETKKNLSCARGTVENHQGSTSQNR